jgi:diacylglycerol kinase family enzyme
MRHARRVAGVLIVNPFASRVDEARLAAVRVALGGVEVLRTERPGHATELARQVEQRADAIYVFAGDGGFNEVVNGLSGRVPVGFVPGGGTSVVPRALGLPRDPLAAARRVAAGRKQRISLGRANGRRFVFSCGIGLDAEAVRRIDARGRRHDGRRPGDLVFALTVARLVVGGAYAEPALEVAGLGRAAFVLAGNLAPYTYAGRIGIRPHPAVTAEGGLDLVAPTRFPLRSLPRFAAYVLRGRGADRDANLLYAHDLDRLVVRADRPLPLQVDGEDLGDATEVLLESERDALDVLV